MHIENDDEMCVSWHHLHLRLLSRVNSHFANSTAISLIMQN